MNKKLKFGLDDATTAFAKKPTLPIKPKRASMSNKPVANPLKYGEHNYCSLKR